MNEGGCTYMAEETVPVSAATPSIAVSIMK